MARVLLIESEPAVHEVIRLIMASHGHTVEGAYSAARARELLDTLTVDLVLLDLVLADDSGLALCRELREHPAWRSRPILMLCGRCRRGDRERATMAGADAFFPLPFDERAVLAWIREQRPAA